MRSLAPRTRHSGGSRTASPRSPAGGSRAQALLELQRSVGNRATTQLVQYVQRDKATAPPPTNPPAPAKAPAAPDNPLASLSPDLVLVTIRQWLGKEVPGMVKTAQSVLDIDPRAVRVAFGNALLSFGESGQLASINEVKIGLSAGYYLLNGGQSWYYTNTGIAIGQILAMTVDQPTILITVPDYTLSAPQIAGLRKIKEQEDKAREKAKDAKKPDPAADTAWATSIATAAKARWAKAGDKAGDKAGENAAVNKTYLQGEAQLSLRIGSKGPMLRITVDGVQTEIPLKQGESDKALDARVRNAIDKVVAKYDPSQATLAPGVGLKPPKGDKDLQAPPEWWVPFTTHASLAEGDHLANAPPYPAQLIMKGAEGGEGEIRTAVEDATYDFSMNMDFSADRYPRIGPGDTYLWEVLPVEGPEGEKAAENAKTGTGQKVRRVDELKNKARDTAEDVAEDIEAEQADPDGAYKVTMFLSGTWRMGKAVLSDLFSGRQRYQRKIKMPQAGMYVIRCTFTPKHSDDANAYIRASTVRVLPVRTVFLPGEAKKSVKRAQEAVAGRLRNHCDLAKLARESTLEGRFTRALALAEAGELGAKQNFETMIAGQELEAKVTARLAKRQQQGDPPEKWEPDELFIATQLATQGSSAADRAKALTKANKDLTDDDHLDKITEWKSSIHADHLVNATMINERTGQQVALQLMVGRRTGVGAGMKKWTIFDVTSPSTRDSYDGTALDIPSQDGPDHAALRAAIRELAGNNDYGRGLIAFAWPDSIKGDGINVEHLPKSIRSTPGKDKRSSQRISDLVEIGAVVGSFGIGGAGATAIRVGAAIGSAALAKDKLEKRMRTGHVLEVGTVLDILEGVGGVLTLAKEANQALQAGQSLLGPGRLNGVVKVVGGMAELEVKLDKFNKFVVVPYKELQQWKAILEAAPGDRRGLLEQYLVARAFKAGTLMVKHAVKTALKPGEPEQAPRPPGGDTVGPGTSKAPRGGEEGSKGGSDAGGTTKATGPALSNKVGSLGPGQRPSPTGLTPKALNVGLGSSGAMKRAAAAVDHLTAKLPANANHEAIMRSIGDAVADELVKSGAPRPTIVVTDVHNPAVWGSFNPATNQITVNSGARAPEGGPAFDVSHPTGVQRLFNLYYHESRHAEQTFHAMRHAAANNPMYDAATLIRQYGVHPDIAAQAMKTKFAPSDRSAERDLGRAIYDESFKPGAAKARRDWAQRTAPLVDQLRIHKQQLEVELAKLSWWKKFWNTAPARELRQAIERTAFDLNHAGAAYLGLREEVDANASGDNAQRVLFARQEARNRLDHALDSLRKAEEMRNIVARLAPHEEKRAVDAVIAADRVFYEELNRWMHTEPDPPAAPVAAPVGSGSGREGPQP